MQISREFISLGGNQNPEACLPPRVPAPRRYPARRDGLCTARSYSRSTPWLVLQTPTSPSTSKEQPPPTVGTWSGGDPPRCAAPREATGDASPGRSRAHGARGGADSPAPSVRSLCQAGCVGRMSCSAPLPDSFVARNAEIPVHSRFPSAL